MQPCYVLFYDCFSETRTAPARPEMSPLGLVRLRTPAGLDFRVKVCLIGISRASLIRHRHVAYMYVYESKHAVLSNSEYDEMKRANICTNNTILKVIYVYVKCLMP